MAWGQAGCSPCSYTGVPPYPRGGGVAVSWTGNRVEGGGPTTTRVSSELARVSSEVMRVSSELTRVRSELNFFLLINHIHFGNLST